MKRSLLLAPALLALLAAPRLEAAGPYSYYSITPCRVADTRDASFGTNGPPALTSSVMRTFQVKGRCGVPSTAAAVSLNITIASPSAAGFVTLWPNGGALPPTSNINFGAGNLAIANGADTPLATGAGADLLSVYGATGSATVHLILDVTGYYQ